MPSPLDGIRVVTTAVNLPGPVAVARLHDLGAAVTKIEPPSGDPLAAASAAAYEELTHGQEVVPIADLAGAERVVSEALAALLLRTRTGEGSYREVALGDACRQMARPLTWGLTTNDGPLGGGLPTYALYRASDGWVALAALEPHFRRRLVEGLGVGDSAAELQVVFATRTVEEWEEWARAKDVPLAAVHEGPA